MTSITNGEIKIVFFSLFFMAILFVWVGLYNNEPIPDQVYQGETSASNKTSTESSSWISNIIQPLPAPFNDAIVLIVAGVILTPIIILLSYIAIRAIKDLISQWV